MFIQLHNIVQSESNLVTNKDVVEAFPVHYSSYCYLFMNLGESGICNLKDFQDKCLEYKSQINTLHGQKYLDNQTKYVNYQTLHPYVMAEHMEIL